MNFGERKSRRENVEINVTSLVDVIFVLLLFFVISTTFNDKGAGVVVELPTAKAADSPTGPKDLVVALTRDNQTIVQGRAVSLDALREILEGFKREAGDGIVVVQADAEVPHGRVVDVIDAAKAQGIARVVIATQGG
jgi:biopolymer transport protein ExbD